MFIEYDKYRKNKELVKPKIENNKRENNQTRIRAAGNRRSYVKHHKVINNFE